MYRMPEKNRKSNRFKLRLELFLSVYKSPIVLLTFHQFEISWLFKDFSICFVSCYITCIFVKVKFFHVNLGFQKEKTLRKCCVYNHGDTYLFCFNYTYMQITLHSADCRGNKKMSPLISQVLAFMGTLLATVASTW